MKFKDSISFSHILLCVVTALALSFCSKVTDPVNTTSNGIIFDHSKAKLSALDAGEVELAKTKLHIAYGHTSHGSQLIGGMEGLVNFKGTLYDFNNGGSDGALDLRDRPFRNASDLGNPNRIAWAEATQTYLDQNSDINVIIWSWCGQVSSADSADIVTYLTLMQALETDYPAVRFVYMTGHLDGSGEDGNLNQRNQQIRDFCKTNNKVLYDFADIESYDPDGLTNYMKLLANDGCYYDSDGNGSRDSNWAIYWQNSHQEGVDWYPCSSAHSQPLNANGKAYVAWYLWCQLAKLIGSN